MNIRFYDRAKHDDFIEKYGAAFMQLKSESDRAAAVVAGAFVDDALLQAIRSRLIDDDAAIKDLLDPEKALGGFGPRARLGYLMGLYDNIFWLDLKLFAKIRNEFAHRLDASSFDEQRISSRCQSFSLMKSNLVAVGATRSSNTSYPMATFEPEHLAEILSSPRRIYINIAIIIIYHLRLFAFSPLRPDFSMNFSGNYARSISPAATVRASKS